MKKGAWLYLQVPWAMHEALLQLATRQGQSLQEVALDMLATALSQQAVPPWYQRFYAAYQRSRMESFFVDQVRSCLQAGDEVHLAEILEQASQLGLDADRILAVASELTSQRADLTPAVQSAVELLLEATEESGRCPATKVFSLAETKGISVWALQKAKKALGLGSERRGNTWYWVRRKL